VPSKLRIRTLRSVAALLVVASVASACSDDDDDGDGDGDGEVATTQTTASADPVATAEARVDDAESGVTDSQEALEASREQFCVDAESYLEVLDRYGKLFTDEEATVGDVQTLGADLVEPRETVATAVNEVEAAKTALAEAEQELIDAEAALAEAIATASSVTIGSTTPATTTSTTIVPPATIERVQQAEDDLARAGEGITAETPLSEATAEYNSAAFALQISWLKLFYDAGCFSDEQKAEAVGLVTAYTTTLQTELQQVGYYDGPIDGIYGPATVDAVKRLQAESGLNETGFVDAATAQALDDLLAELDLQNAVASLTHTASVQTVLKAAGYWEGPIDGVWTDELTAALQEFQTTLGVEPTGVVDAATLAAFEQALAGGPEAPASTVAPTTPAATTPAATTPAPTTPASDTTVPASGEEATLVVAESELGEILVAADGMTLYLFLPDDQEVPTCTDACLGAWPILPVDEASQVTGGDGVDSSLLGTTEHPTEGTQVTYNGWPLYFFSGDSAAGDTNGQGQGDQWYVIDPTGNPILD
jgi:peptidoglycan hydrolase-like protein with peptidoglycan-binding domain